MGKEHTSNGGAAFEAKKPRGRRVTGLEPKGRVPSEAIKANMKVWPLVGPLSERDFTPGEIIDITGLKPRQVYNALHQKDRIIKPNTEYGLPEKTEARREQFRLRMKNTMRGVKPEPYDLNINALVKRIVELGLIDNKEDNERLLALLKAKERDSGSRSRAVVLEAIVRAKRLISQGNTRMSRLYPKLLRAAEEVLYREEDYSNLIFIRDSAQGKAAKSAGS